MISFEVKAYVGLLIECPSYLTNAGTNLYVYMDLTIFIRVYITTVNILAIHQNPSVTLYPVKERKYVVEQLTDIPSVHDITRTADANIDSDIQIKPKSSRTYTESEFNKR